MKARGGARRRLQRRDQKYTQFEEAGARATIPPFLPPMIVRPTQPSITGDILDAAGSEPSAGQTPPGSEADAAGIVADLAGNPRDELHG
jgi:hypothetical protein